jgi:FMN reductase
LKYLIVSCSLNSSSNSRALAHNAYKILTEQGTEVEFLDISKIDLPICDGNKCYSNANVKLIKEKVMQASGILFAVPIYTYDVNAAAKNFVELVGRTLSEKVVGFICAAGGFGSFMSVMPFANSLMLDFRCVIIPRFVYAIEDDINENQEIVNDKINLRMKELIDCLLKFTPLLVSPK